MAVSPYRITLRYQTVEAAAWDVNADGRITPDEGADLRHDLWTARLAPPAQAGMRLRVEGLDAAGVPRAWILPLSVGQTAVGVATRAYLPALDEAGQTRRAHYTATLYDAAGAVLATAEGVEEDVWAGAVEPIEGQIGIIKDDVEIVKGEIGDAETPGTIKHTLSQQDTRLGDVESDLADVESDIGTLFGDVADLEGDVIGLEAGLEARPIGVLYSADREFYAVYATPDGPEEVLIVKLGALAEKSQVTNEDVATGAAISPTKVDGTTIAGTKMATLADTLARALLVDGSGRAVRDVEFGEHAIIAGQGAVRIDEDGITLDAVLGKFSAASIGWKQGSVTHLLIGTEADLGAVVSTFIDAGANMLRLLAPQISLGASGAPASVHLYGPARLYQGLVVDGAITTGGRPVARRFAQDLPSGNSVLVTHNLGTRDVTVQVYSTSAPYAEHSNYSVAVTTANAVTITRQGGDLAPNGAHRVVIIG